MKKPFAIASGHALTTETAAEVLRAGGNAMDAAVAAALVATVAEPVLAGLLGGGFLMAVAPGKTPKLLDFFVQTPTERRCRGDVDCHPVLADFGRRAQGFQIGAGTIATPGVARGLWVAHQAAGRMPFAELTEPAQRLARQGVVQTPFQAQLLQVVAPILTHSPAGRALYTGSDGKLLGAGARLTNPAYAEVLEEYGREGDRFVMEGEVAAALIRHCTDGGHLRRDDLTRYRALWREPLVHSLRDATLYLNPPPAAGGALIAFTLALLADDSAPALADALALTTEARLDADDPADLLAPESLALWRLHLAQRPRARRGTTHLSVVDGQGMMIALTLSNGEGSGTVLPDIGIMPNNMLGEDDLLPDGPESFVPDSRLSSMMCPMLIRRGREWLGLGSGGSARIRSALARVSDGLLRGQRLAVAISAPRLHVETAVDADGRAFEQLDYEETGLPLAEREALLARWPGARGWAEPAMFFGGVHAVAREDRGGADAFADPRRDGAAITGAA